MNLKSTSPLLPLMAAFSVLGLCTSGASAATLISDTFTGTNGQSLGLDSSGSSANEHSPDINVTGNPYFYNSMYNQNPITIQENEASIPSGSGGVAVINLASSSTPDYVKPTTLTISADLETNDIATENTFDKLGLGFYSAPQPGQVFQGFLGLALSANGTVTLLGFPNSDNFDTSVNISQAYSLGTFDPTAFHTLTYTINTVTGGISDATLTDVNGTETYSFTTNLFTDAQTTYAGFYARSDNSPATALVDNFSVTTTVVPEPSVFALMAVGLLGVVFFVQTRRARSAFRG